MNEIVFSIDPGSIRSGWALMKPPEQLIKAGLLLPGKKTALSEFRIGAMCKSIWQLLNLWMPKTILLEWTSGKIGKRHGSGGGAGLAIHGAATGALWREVLAWLSWQPPENQIGTNVILVRENDWTRGVPKKERAVAIACMFQEYKPEQDASGDIADAIGLAIWFIRERKMRSIV